MYRYILMGRLISILLLISTFSYGETRPFISRFAIRSPYSFQSQPPSKMFNKFVPLKAHPKKGYIGPPTAIPVKSQNKPSSSNPLLKLTVHIPPATVSYGKELDVKSGGEFTLITPMENFHYSSEGNVALRCAAIQYQMQSSYSPSLTCFYLYFLTMKKQDEGNPGLCYMITND